MLALCPLPGRNDRDVFVPGDMQKALKDLGRWNDREQLSNQEKAYQPERKPEKNLRMPGRSEGGAASRDLDARRMDRR